MQHSERTTAKTLVYRYMDLSKIIHLVPYPLGAENPFMVSHMGPRHTRHIGVLVGQLLRVLGRLPSPRDVLASPLLLPAAAALLGCPPPAPPLAFPLPFCCAPTPVHNTH